METTVGKLMQAQQNLGLLTQLDWPVMTSYRLARMIKEIGDKMEPAETTRVGLVKKYGKQEGEGWQIDPKDPEAVEAFGNEVGELYKEPVSLSFAPVTLYPSDDMTIKPAVFLALGDLVTLEVPEDGSNPGS